VIIANGEDILWLCKMMRGKNSDIILKTYANVYELTEDKSQSPKQAQLLDKGYSLGTVKKMMYNKALEIWVK
jgi:hypothetical protein